MQSYHVCQNSLLANEEESIYGHSRTSDIFDLADANVQ